MGRPPRADEASAIYHMLNRANRRAPMFLKDADYEAFQGIMAEALDRVRLRLFLILSYATSLVLGRQSGCGWRDEPIRSVAAVFVDRVMT
jgi:hypothetical protein